MKKGKRRLDTLQKVWIITLVALSTFSVFAVFRLLTVWPKENFEQKIVGSIKRQGIWFTNNQTEAGDLVYERYAATGEVKEGNNIVRQAGVLYGLGQLYGYTHDPKIQATFEKGLTYFRGLTGTPGAEMNSIVHNGGTQTNTVALLVLGLVEYLEAEPKEQTTENLEYVVRLSNYLVSTQTSAGAYVNDYMPKPAESDYNNGETMYALIRSYNLTQKKAYLLSVKRMANYAIYHYGKQEFNSSFFSWGMAGFAYLYRVEKDEKYWQFLKNYEGKYFVSRGKEYEETLDNKTTASISPGTSVFLEGVGHIAWIAKDKDAALYKKLKRHIERVLGYLLRYEIGGPYGRYVSKSASVSGAICSQTLCETTRIDFLQHNMSAIILYLRFLK